MVTDNKLVRTLDDLVSYGTNSEFSDKKMVLLRKEDNIVFADDLVYDRYRNQIFKYRIGKVLTDEEQQKFKFKPDRFAMEMYGNPNLANLVLYVNNCSETEFATNQNIYYLDPDGLKTLLASILVHETTNIAEASKKAFS